MVHQSCSIAQNFVVNHHLVVSYHQQCHIGINVAHWYVIIITYNIAYNIAFWIFLCRTLNNFCKPLVVIVICNEKQTNWQYKQIMSKSHGIFNVNFTIFFQIQEKPEMCQNLNLANSRRPSFGDNINVTFTSQQPVPWIINNYI